MASMKIKWGSHNESGKRRGIIYTVLLSLILIISIDFHKSDSTSSTMQQIEQVEIEGQIYTLIFSNYKLYIREAKKQGIKPFLQEALLDVAYYDTNQDGIKELLVLTLNEARSQVEGRRFGKELRLYSLEMTNEGPIPSLMYKNDIGSVNPFSIRVGKLEAAKDDTTVFVGVYKATKYYKDVINRPFFFSWNGEFIERKWTGSYLSHHELIDLAFVDLTGDGADEIAVLERRSDGTYQVSLYKWLNFGFEYLTSSKKKYTQPGYLRLEESKGQAVIKLWFAEGKEERVDF